MSQRITEHFSNLRTDPLRNFKFVVTFTKPVISSARMGFMSVSGMNASTEIIPYREGGNNTSSRKLPGQTNYSDITLTNGVILGGDHAFKWMSEIFHVIQGQGGAPGNDFRSEVNIYVMDHPVGNSEQQPAKARFRVYNAWPSAIAYSDLDSGGNAVLVQQMVLAHEGWNMELAKDPGGSSV